MASLFAVLVLSTVLSAPSDKAGIEKTGASNVNVRKVVSELWHEAGVAYAQRDIRHARDLFRSIVELCPTHKSRSLKWYEGVAQYGLASTSARLSDTTQTRSAVLAALQLEFWNFSVLRTDPVLCQIVGDHWLDSVIHEYELVQGKTKQHWENQSPIVILPYCKKNDGLTSSGKPRRFFAFDSLSPRLLDSLHIHRPLIIALHGGNASYREFASHWVAVADSLNVAVLIPPGCVRHSSLNNSWDDNFNNCEQYISGLIERYEQQCGYHPKLFIAGFSQGALTAIKYGMVHSDRVSGIISVSGYLDRPLPQELIRSCSANGLHIFAMSGALETIGFRSSIEQASRACQAGHVPFELQIVPGMVHEVPEELATRLTRAWPRLSSPSTKNTEHAEDQHSD